MAAQSTILSRVDVARTEREIEEECGGRWQTRPERQVSEKYLVLYRKRRKRLFPHLHFVD